MPYLRLYSANIPIVQKRVIARNLIDISHRVLNPHSDEGPRTTIQFITLPQQTDGGLEWAIPRRAHCMLEVIAHDLTKERRQAFAAQTASMLAQLMPINWLAQIARRLGLHIIKPENIAFQFSELSPAVSDPWETNQQPLAA
jgi:hypothetical protein